jgi:plasmid replication initiation protein
LAIPSNYSNKLFQLLKSWDDGPEKTLSLDYLQDTLDVPPALRERFSNLKARVLKPAYKHIHAKTSLVYEYEEIKEGRKVVAIRFIFAPERIAEHKAKLAQAKEEKKTLGKQRKAKKQAKDIKTAFPCFKRYEKSGSCPKDKGAHCRICQEFFWRNES